MLTAVEVYNAAGGLVKVLPMQGREPRAPYFIKDIEGLGPVPASIITTNEATRDGEVYQAATTGNRNIVLTLGFVHDFATDGSVRRTRETLYSVLPVKGFVRLRFRDSVERTVEIEGYVETHEPKIFTKEPEVVISIICPGPYFRSIKTYELTSYNNKMITPAVLGNVQTGFVFDITLRRNTSEVRVRNGVQPDIVYEGRLYERDRLLVSTIPGKKYIRIVRESKERNALSGLTSGSLSMTIGPEAPWIMGRIVGDAQDLCTIRYSPKYSGI